MCCDYELPLEEEKKMLEKEKKISQQPSEITRAEEKPIAA